MYSVYMSTRV